MRCLLTFFRTVYNRFVRKVLRHYTDTYVLSDTKRKYVVLWVGAATFFFGFFAGALLNVYLIAVHSPLVTEFRASLNYKSAIFGDGIILPIVNMIVAYYLLQHKSFIKKRILNSAFLSGAIITVYFHVNQAVHGLVNWTMPQPWQWNILGVWHALYMFSVASLLSLFYLVILKQLSYTKRLPMHFFIVTAGVILFFILLHLDYVTVSLRDLLPGSL